MMTHQDGLFHAKDISNSFLGPCIKFNVVAGGVYQALPLQVQGDQKKTSQSFSALYAKNVRFSRTNIVS